MIKVKSWRYWYGQSFINAEKEGTINDEAANFNIAINWHESEVDYPVYEVWLERGPDLVYKNIKKYKKRGRFELMKDNIGLRLYPNREEQHERSLAGHKELPNAGRGAFIRLGGGSVQSDGQQRDGESPEGHGHGPGPQCRLPRH